MTEKKQMSEIKEIWTQRATTYDEGVNNFLIYHRSHEAICDLLYQTKPMSILDVGSGTGTLAQKILQRIPQSSITCLDFSNEMMEECKHKLASFGSRVVFICEDIQKWLPTRQYDAIVTCNTFIYKGLNIANCYVKYAGALKPGGYFLNSTIIQCATPSFLETSVKKLTMSPDGKPQSQKELEATQGYARKISHAGKDSLLNIFQVEEHIKLMQNAGLQAACVWQYLFQTVILGINQPAKK